LSFTERFTDRAASYATGRPSYPPESIDVLFDGMGDPASLAVADLGAGTGISSRAIAERGPRVLAIEPNAAMRANAAPDERITWVDGTAEATTLPAASVDVVAAFQAWHWVDHPVAVAEARRILRPGGRLAAVYNERDERDPFTAGWGVIVRKYALEPTEQRRADALNAFAAIEPRGTQRFAYGNTQRVDRAGMRKRLESTSYIPQSGAASEAMLREFDELFASHERDGFATIHLVTLVVRVDA
jgi:SAM-dependent methyltransferase